MSASREVVPLLGSPQRSRPGSVCSTLVSEVYSRRTAPAGGPYRQYPIRWAVLLSYCLLQVANSMTWITYTAVSSHTSRFYGMSQTWIDTLSIIFMVVYLPVSVPASWMLEVHGLRKSLLVGGCLTMMGSWLRFGGRGHDTFACVMAGQVLCASGQPMMQNAAPKLSATWFSEEHRSAATTAASLSQLVGCILAFVLPPAIIDDEDSNLPLLNFVFAVVCTFSFFVAVFLLRDKPPTPPSLSADAELTVHDFAGDVRTLLRSGSFIRLSLTFGLGLGVFNNMATVMAQLVEPFGYTSTDVGMFGGLSIGCGIVGGAVAAAALDATRRYKEALLIAFTVGAGITFSIYTQLKDDNLAALSTVIALQGFLSQPALPIALEYGAELAYPLDESLPAGFLFMQGQLFGIMIIYSSQAVLDHGPYDHPELPPADFGAPSAAAPDNAKMVTAGAAMLMAIAGLFGLTLRPDYRRMQYELEEQEQRGEAKAGPAADEPARPIEV
eukprot:TRINITY_DN5011_c0_g1_i1.p1 TRINITY_DN5011_c0_g1~~TRINITY_DN5011_c0_g1_i1.p1  ORF type:complete len:519 (+),score=138.37 TRINITY_DN5011_c0_g1_i1:69-1559(+)